MNDALTGRSAIITGASQGLGLAIAHAYVAAGANVMLCARDRKALDAARKDVATGRPSDQMVEIETGDVARADDVQRIVEKALTVFPRIDILVNNAGIYGPKGLIDDVDWSEWVRAVEINLFGSVLMCRAILPHFKSHAYGKILQLSGGGATNPLPRISAYAASKAAVVRFAETLAEEVRDDHIDVNSIAPGPLNTRLLEEVLAGGPEAVGQVFYDRCVRQKQEGGVPLKHGAALAVFLGSSASDGITGKLFSAVWDPWTSLSKHLEELQRTDIYTLRRIVPKDRGFTWGDA
jgi:NAD(P)-dependent dehydrogenase (short-subunit alcohol dehydrogenase family)